MTAEGALLVAALATPLVMLLACVSRRLRERIPDWLALAPVPALAASLVGSGKMSPVQFPPPFA